jgi:hypothetical protein
MSWPRPAAGAHQALTARGLPTRSDWFFAGDFSLESGKHCATEWMALQHRPSAVFCASDEMACGFIGEVQRRGLLVPKDVSVVGFDNIDLVAHITAALTTISQPRRAIGETAARAMLALMAGDAPSRMIRCSLSNLSTGTARPDRAPANDSMPISMQTGHKLPMAGWERITIHFRKSATRTDHLGMLLMQTSPATSMRTMSIPYMNVQWSRYWRAQRVVSRLVDAPTQQV